MESKSAVIVIPNDQARTGRKRPLFLHPVLGAPLLTWLANALTMQGVTRYFLVCQERYLSEAKQCLPEACDIYACADREAGDPLHVFLSCAPASERQVLIITGTCVCLPPEKGEELHVACACQVPGNALVDALDEPDFSFTKFLVSHGNACTQLDGMYSISDPGELAAVAGKLKMALLQSHANRGVELWDMESCYIDPGVTIGAGTVLRPGTVLRGRTSIGADCILGPNTWLENASVGSGCQINASQLLDSAVGNDCAIGPYSVLRSESRLGNRVRVGSNTELGCAILGEGTHIGASCCLREFTCGRSCIIGSNVCTAACLPENTGRTTIEDDAIIGAGTIFAGPGFVGRSAAVSPGSTITQSVPTQALATARSRQITKKDWVIHQK